ncbi:MAG: hypothetical protein IKM28_00700 [Lachnospiraceae bacterium]|nr:hypothetical protein [Lachnospiraceae bacterium]
MGIFKDKTKDINGYVVASLTDEYIVDTWPMTRNRLEGKEDKLLEVRVFDTQQEVKLFRTSMGREKAFRLRHIIDDEANTKESMDEVQILDIDMKKSKVLFEQSGEVYTTGGGRYYLPLKSMENAKIKIRHYLDRYEASGQARISDWRLVDFEGEK